jgi:outer membrane protein OmpA-like peptidoglycan-associated protein
LTAREALDDAERAHENEPAGKLEKHLAYVAHRKAQLAMATADLTFARGSVEQSKRMMLEVSEAQRKHAQEGRKKSQSDLAYTEAELSEAQEELTASEAKLRTALHGLSEMAKIKAQERDLVITLNGAVLFETGKTTLMPIAKDRLRTVAEAIKGQDGAKKIVVAGHTDNIGGDAFNQKLSRERAEAVRSFLISEGISPDRVSAIGMGEAEPVVENQSAEGRANNRRVEIILRDQG